MFVYFLCNNCEAKYPKRAANVFPTRKTFRSHLKKEHSRFGLDFGKQISLDSHGIATFKEGYRIYA